MNSNTPIPEADSLPIGFPPIRVYLISMNLALLLLFAVISLLFWRQVSDFRETKQAEDIEAMHDSM
ncbi:MAG: hypothetical protein KZQ88_17060, partial [Candidatus Thiodiazotropha sp. (ex Dulcina madagascariensis)]|nr:hypothetical protein [Candidatus Thiodiazotropha sp. (ex Dulcina madagascariensis)]